MTFNYIDFLIILGILGNTLFQIRLGFFVLTRKLFSFIGAALLSFLAYDFAANFLKGQFDLAPGLSDALGFVILFFILNIFIDIVLMQVFSAIPENVRSGKWSKIFGSIPAFVDSLIIVALILFILVIIPAFPDVKRGIEDSYLGSPMVDIISGIEFYLVDIFGGFGQESLTFLTILPESDETLEIAYKPENISVDAEAEKEMLKLLNAERIKRGVEPVAWDESIVPVARDHSRDMWQRGYFSHTNPDGEGPADRMIEGGVNFVSAGENLALSRNVEQAHQGLMNSPGHRANILRGEFTRVGIGVIGGGIYGKMFTQNFAR